MIESLHIEDLGVIEEADLPLSRGLTALTGETGAGKTMVLTSLGLLLGQRAETTIVRTGAERSLVEGAFLVDPDSRAASRAAFLAWAWASMSAGVRGPCVVPTLPSVRRHEMVRASRTPNRAR